MSSRLDKLERQVLNLHQRLKKLEGNKGKGKGKPDDSLTFTQIIKQLDLSYWESVNRPEPMEKVLRDYYAYRRESKFVCSLHAFKMAICHFKKKKPRLEVKHFRFYVDECITNRWKGIKLYDNVEESFKATLEPRDFYED